jgi:hypothetical protein
MSLSQCRDCFMPRKGVAPPAAVSHAEFLFFTCAECNTTPILGCRFTCTVRTNFDLCESCERLKLQPHPMLKLYTNIDQPAYVETGFQLGGTYRQTVFNYSPLPLLSPVKTGVMDSSLVGDESIPASEKTFKDVSF